MTQANQAAVSAPDRQRHPLARGLEILTLMVDGREQSYGVRELGHRLGVSASAGARWLAARDPGVVLWDFHDARNSPGGALEVHSLIYAIGLCLVDNCLLGPAAAAMAAAGVSDGLVRVTRTPG